MKNSIKSAQKGFTLVELMVVIAIIGILSAIILANFTTARSKSRDGQRISDISQIQYALAAYFNQCKQHIHIQQVQRVALLLIMFWKPLLKIIVVFQRKV